MHRLNRVIVLKELGLTPRAGAAPAPRRGGRRPQRPEPGLVRSGGGG
ncbi:hypothetical protein ACLQ22_08685 [Micromonospora sp. DT178]